MERSKEPFHLTEGVAGLFRPPHAPVWITRPTVTGCSKYSFTTPPTLGTPFRVGRDHKMMRRGGDVKLYVERNIKLGSSSMAYEYVQTFYLIPRERLGRIAKGKEGQNV